MRQILLRYDRVEAIEGEKITEETFHQRNSSRADYSVLRKKTVNIFGAGAIGGELTDCLGKAGVGCLSVFDNQVLKAHNAVRHLCGFDYIGEPKSFAVTASVRNHNPFVSAYLNVIDLYTLEADTDLLDTSLSVSSAADDNLEGYINEQLVIANRPAFYVRALRGGTAARIFRVIPGKDACFNCLILYKDDKTFFTDIPEDPAYPTLRNECNNPIRPASAADIKFIAAMAARKVIDHLQEKQLSSDNHWVWSSEAIDDTEIKGGQILSQALPPHPGCQYCHHEREINVTLPSACLKFMQRLVSDNPEIETGGVLAGYTDENADIIITDVSGPGPNAKQSADGFEKDVPFCQQFLDALFTGSGEKTVYVGEWHSHPSANNHPSGRDIRSLTDIGLDKKYLTDMPVMIILSNTGIPSVTVHPAGKRFYFTQLQDKAE
jgi:integrative and conjugative element protein (TIGR02256 family)